MAKEKLNKDPKKIPEICRKCGKKAPRAEMKHSQTGFGVYWKCKDDMACHLRQ